MGRFSTRNGDGASGLGEPANTVPTKDQRGMERVARHHMCDTTSELYAAPTLNQRTMPTPAECATRN